jgi:hypothetical protein
VPFSIDSIAVNAPSYPAHAVEANPAIALETPPVTSCRTGEAQQ